MKHPPSLIAAFLLLALFTLATGRAETRRVQQIAAPDGGIQPQAVVDAKGVVHLIYFKGEPRAGDILYLRREVGHDEFSQPIPVNSQPRTAMAMGTIRGAQLAVGKNGRLHVVWDGMGEGAHAHNAPAAHTLQASDAAHAHSPPAHDSLDRKQPLFYTHLNDDATAFEPERNVITYAYGLDGGSSVAADPQGNVYVVWHAPGPGNTNGEAGRAVFIARSSDDGKTFQRETAALVQTTGACACCGLKAFADSQGNVFAMFRAATEMTNRNETLLFSRNHGAAFEIAYSHHWALSSCPMSSASLSESESGVLAAAETHGRVFFVRLDPQTGKASSPVSPDTKAKHPVAIGNARGEVLLAWAETNGWGQGGAVAWQLYDGQSKPTPEKGRVEGLKPWSLPTAFAEPDGTFTVIY